MLIGNERKFNPGHYVKDENAGHLKWVPSGPVEKNIYIWWTFKEYKRKDGSIRFYRYFHYSCGGKRETFYCREDELYPQEFMDRYQDFMLIPISDLKARNLKGKGKFFGKIFPLPLILSFSFKKLLYRFIFLHCKKIKQFIKCLEKKKRFGEKVITFIHKGFALSPRNYLFDCKSV